MRIPILVALTLVLGQSQAPRGVIEGRVLRASTKEPISDVLITLTPPATTSSAALAPDAAARLQDQIASLTASGNRAGVTQQVIDNAIDNARRSAGTTPGRPLTVMTDASGHFAFRELTPGRYTIRSEKDGYFATPLNGNAPTAVTKSLTIEDGKTAPPEDLLMVKGAVVSGRVRDPNGQPISGMTVSVYRVSYNNGKKVWSSANSKVTDDLGDYRAFWFAPGEYYVGVTPRAPGTIPGPQDSWSRTFFPGVTEPASAMPIELHDGGDVSGTDLQIASGAMTAFKISGVVLNSAVRPNPTTGAVDRSVSSFILVPRDSGVLDASNSVANALAAAARVNGEFELRNVRAGSYDLYPVVPQISDTLPPGATAPPGQTVIGTTGATIQMINGVVTTTGSATINRRQPTSRTALDMHRDVADLRIVVNAGVPLSGEVVVNGAGSQSIKPESIRLTLRALDTLPTTFTSGIGTIPVDASGKFSIPNVPEARYTFQITGVPATGYVADIRQGGTSVMDNGFLLDGSLTPIQIVIEMNGGTVQGIVQNAAGKPAANATVVLVPVSSRRQNVLLYRNASTGEMGNFTLRGVPPGQYTIFAWESVLTTAWMNAEYLVKYENRGHAVAVSASAALDVQLNLIPFEGN